MLYDAFLAAGEQAGQGTSDDLNGFKPEGVARLDRTVSRDGRRASAATAHLEPALARENLQLLRNAAVDKVEIDGRRATGVRLNGGELISAKREVLLCAGAIKTPQLLMLSGVGGKDQLESIGVDVVADLQRGRPKLDGPRLRQRRRRAAGRPTPSTAWRGRCKRPPSGRVGWWTGRAGRRRTRGRRAASCLGLMPTVPEPAVPLLPRPRRLPRGRRPHAAAGLPDPGRPVTAFSRGRVAIKDRNPAFGPLRALQLLERPAGRPGTRRGRAPGAGYRPRAGPSTRKRLFRLTDRLLRLPDKRNAPDAELEAFVRATCGTDYHPSGTAKMGSGSDAVVDAELRVHGVEGLRVVDASVLPSIVSGNLNAPVQMIARKAADAIRGVEGVARTARFPLRRGRRRRRGGVGSAARAHRDGIWLGGRALRRRARVLGAFRLAYTAGTPSGRR